MLLHVGELLERFAVVEVHERIVLVGDVEHQAAVPIRQTRPQRAQEPHAISNVLEDAKRSNEIELGLQRQVIVVTMNRELGQIACLRVA